MCLAQPVICCYFLITQKGKAKNHACQKTQNMNWILNWFFILLYRKYSSLMQYYYILIWFIKIPKIEGDSSRKQTYFGFKFFSNPNSIQT